MSDRSVVAIAMTFIAAISGVVFAEPPPVSDLAILPGDRTVEAAPEAQEAVAVAAGGPGSLVVWEDLRMVLDEIPAGPSAPLLGNGRDIYAARLDPSGAVLDPTPIVLDNRGRDQREPATAWNDAAGAWLTVWMSERPDWYFFEDLMAARVAADGTVLDDPPVTLRAEQNDPANDHAQAPAVASNGSEWLVVWRDVTWNGTLGYPNVTGLRVGADGTPIGTPTVLYQHDLTSGGPNHPRVAWSNDVWMVAWDDGAVEGLRFDGSLQALDPEPLVFGSGFWKRVAGNGNGFMVVTSAHRAYRVASDGTILDPAGIQFSAGYPFGIAGPEVAWDGLDWVVTFGAKETNHYQDDPDLYMARIGADGTVQSPGPAPVHASPLMDVTPVPVPAQHDGEAVIVFSAYRQFQEWGPDIKSVTVDVTGTPGPVEEVSVGLPRQWHPRTAAAPGMHLVAFLSERSGETRIVVQRIGADGVPLDPEPTEIAVLEENTTVRPDVAFDGTRFLVVWTQEVDIYGQRDLFGRRVALDGVPVDPAPVMLLADDQPQNASVGAVPGQFLVGYTHLFSGDRQELRSFPLSGDTLAALAAPTTIGANFTLGARIAGVGSRYLVVWNRQATHDQGPPYPYAAFVEADGTSVGGFSLSAGTASDIGLAAAPDRVLALWSGANGGSGLAVKGKVLGADGTPLSGDLVIADAAGDQRFPAAGWDGSSFVVAWTDYRSVAGGIEQLRGDVWAARVGPDGSLPDPDGFQLSSGPLPEDLPAVASADGVSIVLFSLLDGVAVPEVQRLGLRVVGEPALPAAIFADGFESGDLSVWSAAVP